MHTVKRASDVTPEMALCFQVSMTSLPHTQRFLLPGDRVFSMIVPFLRLLLGHSFFAFSDVRVLKNVLTLFLRAKF